MLDDWNDMERLRSVFDRTEVVRKPLTGIIAGHHVLPYVLVGPEGAEGARALEVRGRIRVSPRMVIGVGGDGPTYGQVFEERDVMHRALVARVFSFRYASRVNLESEELKIRRYEREPPAQLDRVLEELAQREIIDTAVISSPDARFYPVSLDRFIRDLTGLASRGELGR